MPSGIDEPASFGHTHLVANREIPVELKFENYGTSEGTVVVHDRNPASRLSRGLIALAICWGIGAICIFIPLFHFVAVPTMVITGIVLFALRLREGVSIVEVRGYCPSCKEEKIFPAGGRFHDHRTVRCNQCAEKMELIEHQPEAVPEKVAA